MSGIRSSILSLLNARVYLNNVNDCSSFQLSRSVNVIEIERDE